MHPLRAGAQLAHCLGTPQGQYGQEGLRFWTKNKVVTQRWPDGGAHGESAFIIPTMG